MPQRVVGNPASAAEGKLDQLDNLDAAIERTDGISIAEKAARFFNLSR